VTIRHDEAVSDAVRKLAESIGARADELVEEILGEIARAVPEYYRHDQPWLLAGLRRSTHANVKDGIAYVLGEIGLPEPYTAWDTEATRVVARAGVPLDAVLRSYRLGHATVWEWILGSIRELELDRATADAVLRRVSRALFAYHDRVMSLVTEEYAVELARFRRGREWRRKELVEELLGGERPSADELDYELGGRHVGLIAWGADVDALLRLLESRSGGRLLSVFAGEEIVWAWVGSPRGSRSPDLEMLLSDLPDNVAVAAGDPLEGLDGFRASHLQARAAYRVAMRRPRRLTHHHDVAIESLALQDESTARGLVSRELGPLLGSERGDVLIETLRAYFAAGNNAAAAAASLGVHERTVANRLQEVEKILGHSLRARRAELELALRIRELPPLR
jgi:hypothetical protein